MSTVGTMLVEEPTPALPVEQLLRERCRRVFTARCADATQTRPGNDVAPSQMKRRGSASMLGWPITAWLGRLREIVPITVPSRGAADIEIIGGGEL